ncbi:Uncharacterised protein [BD1-7 clade bacterium]|uniref:Putative Flp pilus-assembly TadG-like N-terminal domain-containing protein n=1 Tax=BD1-7 clade bacterium TaxID=2029982 RepID=A0A5S9Q664_9GAMM|nr:Uncharacterised protein [BD1-7 clade bacterium]CAA0113987.1 Uncharacterised protein [BD1-7 clade bacterium]
MKRHVVKNRTSQSFARPAAKHLPMPRAIGRQQRGNVAISAVIVLPILLMMVAFSIDVSNQLRVKSRLADGVEAAALAVTLRADDSSSNNKKLARAYLRRFFEGSRPSVNGVTQSNNRFDVAAQVDVDMLMMHRFFDDADELLHETNAAAQYRSIQEKRMEIALVLDLSGSMSSPEAFGPMIEATNRLMDLAGDNVAISIVPFSGGSGTDSNGNGVGYFAASVNPRKAVAGKSLTWLPNVNRNYCVKGAQGSAADAARDWNKTPDELTPEYLEQTGGQYLSENCVEYPILSLTHDRQVLKDYLATIVRENLDSSDSIIYEGIIWGARVLSDDWQGFWGSDDLPTSDPDVEKHLIMLSDAADAPSAAGFYLRDMLRYYYAGAAYDLCDDITGIRSKNINLHLIGYQTNFNFDTWTRWIYATGCFLPENMTQAGDADGVISAFEEVLSVSASSQSLILVDPK